MAAMLRAGRALLGMTGIALFTPGFNCGPTLPELPEPEHVCVAAELPSPDDGLPAIAIGQCQGESFAELASGAVLAEEHGPQGGSHVTLTLRLFADKGTRWRYDLAIEAMDGTVLAESGMGATTCPGAWVESTNVRVFIFAGTPFSGTLRVSARPDESNDPVAVRELPVEVR
jgi:hypothetical protein